MSFEFLSKETRERLSASALEEIHEVAFNEAASLRASVNGEDATQEQADQYKALLAYLGELNTELDDRAAKVATFNAEPVRRTKAVESVEAAAAPEFNTEGVKDVAATVVAPATGAHQGSVVEATLTAAAADVVVHTGIADAAQTLTLPDVPEGPKRGHSLLAAAPLSLGVEGGAIAHNQPMEWLEFAKAFQEASGPNQSKALSAGGRGGREHTRLASIRREATADRTFLHSDKAESVFAKMEAVSLKYKGDVQAGRESIEAANGFCSPSTPLYTTCSPITATGLWTGPRMVASRGGIIHNQGLDFGDFFGDDFALPIPGHNILTEAQVIADTAKTCFEIPCPPFVDDRLNIAALCLTGSILQNRTYPEFVSTFVEGSIDAMAHLVNREVINAIVTGSTTVALGTVDPWVTDGSTLSQLLSAVEMAVVDMRYIYRTDPNQVFDVVLPIWIKAQLRADYIRRNAAANNDISDAELVQMFRTRGANVQFVYDWQDAFNATGTITIPAANQAGTIASTGILALPFNVGFLIYLPGTWVLAELDIIRLDMVYDSTLLAQNQVTQLFMEDGFKPMKMCQHSRLYTVNICPNGSTGVQRAVACADITP